MHTTYRLAASLPWRIVHFLPAGLSVFAGVFFLTLTSLTAQTVSDSSKTAKPPAKKWYETISVRGYTQARYNRLLETNPDLKCEQCDRSWGENGGFFLRRVRVIFFGQIGKRVYYYLQPDFANAVSSSSGNFAQIRDAYFDIGVDKKNEFRFRIGQSKVPFGFENMQSSQNRLPLDRNDALNSAVANERDLGIFFYWAPEKTRKLFSDLVRDGLKGSGDYGVFALGLYNGQTANKPELNNEPHVVTRLSYPFQAGKQIIEASLQAYTGTYTLAKDQVATNVRYQESRNYTDQRVAASFVLYPKPFGIQAEYMSYMTGLRDHILVPYARYQYYRGGKKHETDARSYEVSELELGIEWQPVKQFELVCAYTISGRRFEDMQNPDNFQRGNLLRLQAQVNF